MTRSLCSPSPAAIMIIMMTLTHRRAVTVAAAAIPSHAGTGPLSQAFSLRFGGSESFFISARPAALRVPASAAAVQVGPGLPQAPGPASRHRHGVPSAPSPRLSSPHRASDRDFQADSVSESPTRQWPRVSDRRRGTASDLKSEFPSSHNLFRQHPTGRAEAVAGFT
jgi:hypothetical protein